MNIVFAGTPEFAVPSLDAVAASGHRLTGVLTQPDRPAGRGRRLSASPVKQRALALGAALQQPERLNDAAALAALAALEPDLMVVVAYGLILPRRVLALPRHGCINVHASLLPRWRGAAPIARALLVGDRETGVTLMRMDAGLDTGPMIARRSYPIDDQANAGVLHDALAALGAELLAATLAAGPSEFTAATAQDDAQATYARMLDKHEAAIDWQRSASEIARAVRAFAPWPVAHGQLDGRTIRFWRAAALRAAPGAPPGTVVEAGTAGIDIATGDGVLRVYELQWPGKRRLSAADAANGRRWAGQRFA